MEDKKFKTSEAQRRASKKYREKNKTKETYLSAYRIAKSFINRCEILEQLEELNTILKNRIEHLNSIKKD